MYVTIQQNHTYYLRMVHPNINRTQPIVFNMASYFYGLAACSGIPRNKTVDVLAKSTSTINWLFPSEILQLNSIPSFSFVRATWNGSNGSNTFCHLYNQHLCRTYRIYFSNFQIDTPSSCFLLFFYLFFINSTFRTFYINGL